MVRLLLAVATLTIFAAPLTPTRASNGALSAASGRARDYRASVIARAKVWEHTAIPSVDFKVGPSSEDAPALGETIDCTYVKKKLPGNTPKFACKPGEGHELKVKYGGDNGEVYGEVLGTRLLWALGFGADRMYSVRVVCHDCPERLLGMIRAPNDQVFDPAAIEHKMAGAPFRPDDGWTWDELDLVSEEAGGATRAELDALKLLAVFMQHTDTKREQQRLICRETSKHDETNDESHGKGPMPCAQPFMYINDLGVTFGRANRTNDNKTGSTNLALWSKTPVWKRGTSCVGNLPKSATGTLDDPVISEEGRKFLADLLTQLSDEQLRDLFESARLTLRVRDPRDPRSGLPTIDEWVDAFKQKRDEIVNRTCSTT
jgi:hypothetical protein